MVQDTEGTTKQDNKEIATTRSVSTDTLRGMQSMDDALQALHDAGIGIVSAAEELGDGFELIDDKHKDQFIGVPFVVLDGSISDGDFGPFASIRLMTRDGRKVIINDGGTGIGAQVAEFLTTHSTVSGLFVPHGLRVSRFTFCEQCKGVGKENVQQCGKCGHSPMKPAATYYLDTSK